MGTIWVEGQFKNSAKPVKVVGGSGPDTLKNYATKSELQKAVEDLTASQKRQIIMQKNKL